MQRLIFLLFLMTALACNVTTNTDGSSEPPNNTPTQIEQIGNNTNLQQGICLAQALNDQARVYAEPDASTAPIAIMEQNTWLPLLTQQGDFLNVSWGGVVGDALNGWVHQNNVSAIGCFDPDQADLANLPLHHDPGAPPTNACVAVHPGGTQVVLIHASPSPLSDAVANLGNWIEVVFQFNDGWLQVLLFPVDTGYIDSNTVNLIGTCE